MTQHEEIGISIGVYEPLTTGADKIATIDTNINSYAHTLQANGGFDTMTVTIAGDRISLDEWIEQGIARHIVVYNSANLVCWEGFVNVVNASMGAYSISIGPMVEMANRVSVAYAELDITTDPWTIGDDTVTIINEDEASQAKYGIIEKVVNAGRMTTLEAASVRDTFLTENANPPTSNRVSIGTSTEPTLTLECLGYWYWTNLYVYNNVAPLAVQVDERIEHILESNPNVGMFGNLDISTNNSIVPSQTEDDKTAMAHIKGFLALGGASEQRYTLGFYENRDVYYGEIPTTPAYRMSLSDQGQRIMTFEGAQVHPWDVRPAQWMFVSDALIGRYTNVDNLYEDPRYIFIEQVDYTAPWNIVLNGSRVETFAQIMARFGLGDF